MKKLISIIIPMYNEKESLPYLYDRLTKLADKIENYNMEFLFVNDGTFLIGRCSMVTHLDKKCIIQSHLRKIRVVNNDIINAYYLFYLLNSNFVQQQIEVKTFVQATLSTLGNRLMEIDLPIHRDKNEVERISNEIKEIIFNKAKFRERSIKLLENSI